MSEIERYDCEEDRSCEYEVKAVMQVDPTGYYVRHADHLVYLNEMRLDRDAQRLRADTAESALEIAQWEVKCRIGAEVNAVEALAAAEQRIAELVPLIGMAKELLSTISMHQTTPPKDWCESFKGEVSSRIATLHSALNPEAESHADDL